MFAQPALEQQVLRINWPLGLGCTILVHALLGLWLLAPRPAAPLEQPLTIPLEVRMVLTAPPAPAAEAAPAPPELKPVPKPQPPKPVPQPVPKPAPAKPKPKPEPQPQVKEPAPAEPSPPAAQTLPDMALVKAAAPGVNNLGNAPAAALGLVKPPYPKASRRNGEEGAVAIWVAVSPEGKASEARVASSSGYQRLDQAALKAALQSDFRPALKNGRPVASEITLTFRFNLLEAEL